MGKENPLFICYSLPLMTFLSQQGIRYEVEGKHKLTDKDFWVYIRTDKLKKSLDTWSLNKPNKVG